MDSGAAGPKGRGAPRAGEGRGVDSSPVLAPLRPEAPVSAARGDQRPGARSRGEGPGPRPGPAAARTHPRPASAGLRSDARRASASALCSQQWRRRRRAAGRGQRLDEAAAPPPPAPPPPPPAPAGRSRGLMARRRVCASGRGAPALAQRAPGAQRGAGRAGGGAPRGPRAARRSGRRRTGVGARPRWGIAAAEGAPGLEAGDGGTRCGLRSLGAAARAQGEWKRTRGDTLRMEGSPKVGGRGPSPQPRGPGGPEGGWRVLEGVLGGRGRRRSESVSLVRGCVGEGATRRGRASLCKGGIDGKGEGFSGCGVLGERSPDLGATPGGSPREGVHGESASRAALEGRFLCSGRRRKQGFPPCSRSLQHPGRGGGTA